MYAAKELHAGFEVYSTEQDRYSPARLALVSELRQAIEDDDMALVYQAKVEVGTDAVTGAEALVRLAAPEAGRAGARRIHPVGRAHRADPSLTLCVIDGAVGQCRRWGDGGLDLLVAVNLSVQSLLDDGFPSALADLLDRWGVPPGRLELEITETSILSDPLRAKQVLTRLSRMGIRLTVEDYGTGYSSLAYLRQLPVDAIKIDRSFVIGMSMSDNDAVIVRSTFDLGHNLGLTVVAEGVETQGVADELARLGCDVAQGFLFSPPVSAGDIVARTRAPRAGVAEPSADARRPPGGPESLDR
jgi:EAL domain-containing protein (putative c-di-GMP-specific phosphodiesterase class I)